jgi:hypothetical protein
VEILSNKEHLTIDGIHKLIAIRASINLGLPPKLKAAFPHIVNYSPRFLVKDIEIKSPYWLSGARFVGGCGAWKRFPAQRPSVAGARLPSWKL